LSHRLRMMTVGGDDVVRHLALQMREAPFFYVVGIW